MASTTANLEALTEEEKKEPKEIDVKKDEVVVDNSIEKRVIVFKRIYPKVVG